MSDMPLITVIVPAYNIPEYLPRCIHSITAQTYRKIGRASCRERV